VVPWRAFIVTLAPDIANPGGGHVTTPVIVLVGVACIKQTAIISMARTAIFVFHDRGLFFAERMRTSTVFHKKL